MVFTHCGGMNISYQHNSQGLKMEEEKINKVQIIRNNIIKI